MLLEVSLERHFGFGAAPELKSAGDGATTGRPGVMSTHERVGGADARAVRHALPVAVASEVRPRRSSDAGEASSVWVVAAVAGGSGR